MSDSVHKTLTLTSIKQNLFCLDPSLPLSLSPSLSLSLSVSLSLSLSLSRYSLDVFLAAGRLGAGSMVSPGGSVLLYGSAARPDSRVVC